MRKAGWLVIIPVVASLCIAVIALSTGLLSMSLVAVVTTLVTLLTQCILFIVATGIVALLLLRNPLIATIVAKRTGLTLHSSTTPKATLSAPNQSITTLPQHNDHLIDQNILDHWGF